MLFGVHVGETERAIRINRSGNPVCLLERIIEPGITWRIPFLSAVQKISVDEQSFQLRNRRHAGPNPHRNALYMKFGDTTRSLNVVVRYQLPAERVSWFAGTFSDIPPKIVVEGVIRTLARDKQYKTFDDMAEDATRFLENTGISVTAIEPLDRKSKDKLNPKRISRNSKKNKNQ
jgi:hypothetical protein